MTGAAAPYIGGVETRTCFHHEGRPTGRACTRCGRPACADCLRDAPVGSHCWECVRAARPPARERARRWNATAGALVSKAIVAVNVAVYALTVLDGGSLSGSGGLQTDLVLFGPAVAGGEWYRLVTAGFVHYGPLHIAFNMMLALRFGEMLEGFLGRGRMAGLYLVALLGGSLGVLLLSPLAPTAGASGAVFGLVGAAAVGLRQRGIDVWASGVGPLLAINLVFTFVIPNVSIGGHVGGLVAGAAAGAVMLRSPLSRRSLIEGVALCLLAVVALTAASLWVAAG